AQDQGRWSGSGITVRIGAAAGSGAPWAGQTLQTSLSVHQNAHAGDAPSKLPAPKGYPGGWDYRGRRQGCLYAEGPTLRNVVDDCGRASDLGPACDSVESCLG